MVGEYVHLKILLLDNSHLPIVGGKEVVVHHLAREYKKRGHCVLLAGPGAYWTHRNFSAGYPIQRFPTLPLISYEKSTVWQTKNVLKRNQFDIVHAHTTYPNTFSAARAIDDLSLDLPLVVTPHGADIHKVPEINFGKRLDPVLDSKIKWALTQCHYATSISKSVTDSLIDAGMNGTHIAPIPNGVDVERFSSPVDLNARELLGIPQDAKFFVSIGNGHPRKGHNFLIDAIAKLSSADSTPHLVLIGHGLKKAKQQVIQRNVQKYVHVLGGLPYPIPGTEYTDTLAALLQQSTGYVSASVGEGSEGLSLALLEAMATETAIVATSVSGNRDIVRDGKNGLLVNPGSEILLAEAMNQLCTNTARRNSLANAALLSVQKFSWGNIATQYLDLFGKLTKGGK